MEAIQNAYQGFAKQNYTMLDNLKLGYGGTKTEMERLIADANKVKEANGEIKRIYPEEPEEVNQKQTVNEKELMIYGPGQFHTQHISQGQSCSYVTILFSMQNISPDALPRSVTPSHRNQRNYK